MNWSFSAVLAVFIHSVVFFFVTFTFGSPKISSGPAFVFLGSFLHAQDMAPLTAQADANASLNLGQLNLDSRRGIWPHHNEKPSLVQKTTTDERAQFKPLMAEPIAPSKPEKINDLGIELEPIPRVRLRIQSE